MLDQEFVVICQLKRKYDTISFKCNMYAYFTSNNDICCEINRATQRTLKISLHPVLGSVDRLIPTKSTTEKVEFKITWVGIEEH